jgi:5'-nucleotidase/UDP-sugar diphosphatase
MKSFPAFFRRPALGLAAFIATLAFTPAALQAEGLTILHVGDQESWLLSAQGNLRNTPTSSTSNAVASAFQIISYYGGVDRLAAVIDNAETTAASANRFVIKLNAGDAFLPGPRFTASYTNLANAYTDSGQDFYDAIALREIGFDAAVFGNHEFDQGAADAARFVKVSETTYLSINLNFDASPAFAALKASGDVASSKIITTPGGKKVGIIGVTTPLLPTISSPSPVNMTAGFSFTNSETQNLQALLPFVQAEIDGLRNNEGVTVIVVMSHLQNAANERNILVPGLNNVDLVVSGGGHELMTDTDDLLINGGVSATFNTHPVYSNDVDGTPTPIVTSHFGNRYVGEVNLTINDTTGLVTAIDSTRMLRVSGLTSTITNGGGTSGVTAITYNADADAVSGNVALQNSVITPVQNFINALNAQIVGQTAVRLNGDRGVSAPSGIVYSAIGVRNAETNLGNLVADAMRFAGAAEVAIQNGGGIRTTVAGPISPATARDVSVGDTFNVLPFTNLVKRAPAMTAAQLKDLLEHSVAASTPAGSAQGRFAQVSGIRVVYDTTRPARSSSGTEASRVGTGSRIREVVMDNGTVLVSDGVVNISAPAFSFATIDFTAAGGDGYPFAANSVAFENNVNTITYQEALADFIATEKNLGGLGRSSAADGPAITSQAYGVENPYDRYGRLVDLAVSSAPVEGAPAVGTSGRDTLGGDAKDNTITGGLGADVLTGGAGGDKFVYNSLREIGDTITDFTPYADKLSLAALLTSVGAPTGNAAVTDGYIKIVDTIGGVAIQLDVDGDAGRGAGRTIATLRGLTAAQVKPARDFSL